MAGIAGDVRLAVRKFGVDLLNHRDHVPGNLLVVVVVACKVALYMAEIAFDPEPCSESHHGCPDVGAFFKNLEILGNVRLLGLLGGILRHAQGNGQQETNGDTHVEHDSN